MTDSRVSLPDRPDRLDGWKAIATHLGRSVRTVQRWELTEGLPVHRHPHQKQASAWAYRDELNEWAGRRGEIVAGTVGPLRLKDILSVPSPPGEAPPSLAEANRLSRRRPSLLGLSVALAASLLISEHQGLRAGATTGVGWEGRETRDQIAYQSFVKGRAAYVGREYSEALEAAEDAITRDPFYASAWILLAKIHGRVSSAGLAPAAATEPAAAAAARALTLAPRSAEAHVAAALAARARRDITAWRDHARRAIAIDGACAEAHAVLADSYGGQLGFACGRDRNPELAESHYQAALALNPQLNTARVNRAQNLAYLGRYEECAAVLSPFIDSSGDLSALATRARCSLMGNDLEAAARDIERLTATPGATPTAVLWHRGWLRIKRGEVASGVADLESLAELHQSFQTELSVAHAYADVGEASRAAEHLERAFAMDAACARTVAAAPSFRMIRHAPEVTSALATYGVR